MYKDFEEMPKIGPALTREIIEYYNNLFLNYEMKSVPEIANDLSISKSTLRTFLEHMYKGKNSEVKYSKISLQILLCTKFVNHSPYYKDQQELSTIIKRRNIVKNLKKCNKSHRLK